MFKLRGFHVRSHSFMPDLSLDFHNPATGSPYQNILLNGPSGSGKSYILQSISMGWKTAVSSFDLPLSDTVQADMMRADFLVDHEVVPIHYRGIRCDASPSLAQAFDPEKNKGCVLLYNRLRFHDEFVKWSNTSEKLKFAPTGLCGLYPVLYDLHCNNIEDSVIMIDDIDDGIDEKTTHKCLDYLFRHYRSKKCQFVFTSRNNLVKKYIESSSLSDSTCFIDLPEPKESIFDQTLSILSDN